MITNVLVNAQMESLPMVINVPPAKKLVAPALMTKHVPDALMDYYCSMLNASNHVMKATSPTVNLLANNVTQLAANVLVLQSINVWIAMKAI